MINKERIKELYEWFCDFVESKQGTPFISFSEGLIEYEEGYKRNIFKKAHSILELDKWKRTDIGNGIIADRVIRAMNASENIVNYHAKSLFKNKTLERPKEAENILYDLYKKKNPEDAFERACEFYGRRFNELSYLLFIKDKDKYVPIRSTIHKKIFEKLELPTDWFKKCTWDSYNEYLQIMYEIRDYLEELFDMPISLLDAHSFVWRVGRDEKNYDVGVRKIREAKKDDDINRRLANGQIDISRDIETTECKAKSANNRKADSKRSTYRRSEKEVQEALFRANYKCEFNNSHKLFKRKKDGLPYTEPHHLIPMCYQNEFKNSLDNWPNIVSLCSHCHNQIHYGEGAEELIRELYRRRKNLLKKAGIGITLKDLLEMYE